MIVGNRRFLIGGDIITDVNGQPVRDWNSLLEYLELHTQVEQAATLSLLRDGRPPRSGSDPGSSAIEIARRNG